jgi:hypothetical protein
MNVRGWRIQLVTVPEYLAAIGSLATLGAVWFVAQQWRVGLERWKKSITISP